MVKTERRRDPYSSFNFILRIGRMSAGFSEVTGILVPGDEEDMGKQVRPKAVRKLVGLRKFTNITMKRGYTTSRGLSKWLHGSANGKRDGRSGRITLFDEKRRPVQTWTFQSAFPSKFSGPVFNAKGNDLVIEELELRVE